MTAIPFGGVTRDGIAFAGSNDSAAAGSIADAENAGTSNVKLDSLTVGIGGFYKNGQPTSVRVGFSGLTEGKIYRLKLETLDSDGTPTRWNHDFTPDSERATVETSLLFGKATGNLTIRLDDAATQTRLFQRSFGPSKNFEKQVPSISSEKIIFPPPATGIRPVWLQIGPPESGLSEVVGELRLDEKYRPVIYSVEQFADLPSESTGFEAVDILFVFGDLADFWSDARPEDPRITSLFRWVEEGGRLVIVGGTKSLPLFREGGALAGLLPGRVAADSLQEIRIANELVQYVPRSKNLVMTGSLDNPFLRVPLLEPAPGALVDLKEMETPILVRQAVGFGTVTFCAADPSAPPLLGWNGRTGFWLRLLGLEGEGAIPPRTDSALVDLGYSDLSGQLRSSLDRFDGVQNFPFSMILVLIFLYILAIGPLDWFVTHRLLKRPNLTWITFPLWILIFSALAVLIGTRTRSGELRVNRVDLVDVDAASGRIRGTSWTGFYSSKAARYDLVLHPSLSPPPIDHPDVRLAWLGLDGKGIGGMASRTVSTGDWRDPYQIEPDGRLTALPVQVRSSKSLIGRWDGKTAVGAVPLLEDRDGELVGTVVNPLNQPLEEAVVYYGKWVIHLGTLPPGETVVDRKTKKIDYSRVLGGAIDPFNENRSNTMTQGSLYRYDTMSADVAYILRTTMFYRMAGGIRSVGLANTGQQYLDASELIRTGRAVLTGTLRPERSDGDTEMIPSARTDLNVLRDGEETPFVTPGEKWGQTVRHPVFLRIIFPVRRDS